MLSWQQTNGKQNMKKKQKRLKDFKGLSTVIPKKDKIPRGLKILAHKVWLIPYELLFEQNVFLEIEAQYARIRVLEEEVSLVRKEKEIEENFKLKALQEVQVFCSALSPQPLSPLS